MRRLAFVSVAACALAFGAQNAQAAPTIPETSFSGTTTTSTTLEAQINPQGKATKYSFEYGLADCSTSTCAQTPKAPELKGVTEEIQVSALIEGLAPGTTYHFRVVASNKDGKAESKETFTTHLLPPAFGPCPNETFRQGSNLPDCRAYEQASPVGKNGGDLWSKPEWLATSTQGDAVTFLSDAGIPGGVGAQELPVYLAQRDQDGWSTKGLLPPASTGQQASVIGWLPDLSQFFSTARSFQVKPFSETLLARESENASLETIVPHSPLVGGGRLYDYAGASKDGSQVLFESEAALTNEAIEGNSNLYLWDRATGELHLAGIHNDQEPPAKGAFAGPYDWFNGTTPETLLKGGADADYYVQEANAVSADGASVFFTEAGTGQLYLRKNPTEEQSPLDLDGQCTDPAKACTIHVSASQKDDGKGDEGRDAAGTAPAAFQAASADGSVAYFTSSEKLTNDANTGLGEPEPAAIARSDIEGKNVDSTCLPVRALGIAVDEEHIYWASPQGTIGRADLDCKEADEAFIALPPVEIEPKPGESALVPRIPQYVAVDDTHIYWTAAAAGEFPDKFPPSSDGTIGRAELNGDGPATNVEADLITGASAPQGIAVDDEYVYWANPHRTKKSIGRAELDGDNANPTFIGMGTEEEMHGVAVNATHIYWVIRNSAMVTRIFRRDIDGNPASQISANQSDPFDFRGLTLDASHVYFASKPTGTVGRAPLSLPNFILTDEERKFITAKGALTGVAVNASHIYWSSNGETPTNPGNDLYRYAIGTGELKDLSVDPLSKNGAEVRGVLGTSEDGSRIYFAANGVLAPGATPGNCKGPNGNTETGICNVYLAHGDEVDFVAEVNAQGKNWRPTANNFVARFSRVNPDGRTLLFASGTVGNSRFLPGSAYHLYDAKAKTTTCITCNPTGEAGGESTPIRQWGNLTPAAPNLTLPGVVSGDGNRVFFETTAPLVGHDVNGSEGCPPVGFWGFRSCQDVYEWEAQGAGSCKEAGGCLYLLSTGTERDPSFLAGASSSGEDVFIFTRAQLVPQDKDRLRDVYDVRVGGGLASQHPVPGPTCQSKEACEGQVAGQPQGDSAPTQAFVGPPNPAIKRKARCPKGRRLIRVKGKRRCVPRRPGKGKGQKRGKHNRTKPNRRGSR